MNLKSSYPGDECLLLMFIANQSAVFSRFPLQDGAARLFGKCRRSEICWLRSRDGVNNLLRHILFEIKTLSGGEIRIDELVSSVTQSEALPESDYIDETFINRNSMALSQWRPELRPTQWQIRERPHPPGNAGAHAPWHSQPACPHPALLSGKFIKTL